VQGYVALVAEGKYDEALRLIKEQNPLPATCGRVCHKPCEAVCTRGQIDEPVAIDDIKRFVADRDLNSQTPYIPDLKEPNDKKIAVIGSGPAGLSCAYYLAREGYAVTIYEQMPEAGGMLSAGIPDYRLPRKVIKAEIQLIQDMGVKIHTGIRLGKDVTIGQLKEQGVQAVFLGTGAQESMPLGIEGEPLEGVYPGLDLLKKINMGNPPSLGSRIAVIGGGNVAMDAVRCARRLGSNEAFILYRRSIEQMPANSEEIEECQEEGIPIHTLTAPVRILGENGRVKAIECIKMELGEPDQSGRRRPIPVKGSEFVMAVDGVVSAIGQKPEWSCLNPESACTISKRGTITVDPVTLQTDDPFIFAGGDAVSGPRTVVEAIEAGKQAAISIDRYLRGEDLREGRPVTYSRAQDIPVEGYAHIPRHRVSRLNPEKRRRGFEEVKPCFTEDQAVSEAKRCISCGLCSECYQCVNACHAGAITLHTHAQQHEHLDLPVGSIIMSPGIELFDPSAYDTYGYNQQPNVITSMEFERILSASGPYGGHMVRPSDRKEPKKIAWIQCVGSRDDHHGQPYCSSVCCTYAIKEAMIAKEHSTGPLDAAVFYIDIRTHGKDFEKYYLRARDEAGVRFIKSKISRVSPNGDGGLTIRYFNGSGKIIEEAFDLVVLSVGLKPKPDAHEMSQKFGIALDPYGFAATTSFNPVESSRPGIYVCGAFKGPCDIPDSVMEAYAAVGASCTALTEVRHTQVKEKHYPEEINVKGEAPRVGVFVCHCGTNIGGVVDVPAVRAYAESLPFVAYAEANLFTCSQDTQEKIRDAIQTHQLNRVVVASCSPRTHESLFRETLRESGLNKYLFEMTNIRDQCSWVHRAEPEKATQKSKDLVRMAVAKAIRLEPLEEIKIGLTRKSLVIGGGIAGMTAALEMANQGFPVCLVEKDKALGGNARSLSTTWRGENIKDFTENIVQQVKTHPLITVYLDSIISGAEGFVGNFRSTITSTKTTETVEHGTVVIATGGRQLEPDEYAFGKHSRVFLSLDFDQMLTENPEKFKNRQTAVFIQCVGSREPQRPYCSKICCTQSIQNALRLKDLNPKINVAILYREIRTYGKREALYREARSRGIVFIRYRLEEKPNVETMENGLRITVMDQDIRVPLQIEADLLVLATAIVPNEGVDVSKHYKTSINQDQFFQEAHVKLRPVDSSTDGVFICGLCHSPKPIEESIAQAKAASARAAKIMMKETLEIEPIVSVVDPDKCSGCGTCERVCPWDAIHVVEIEGRKIAQTNKASCKGCGVCAASCPSKAVDMSHFRQEQIREQIAAFIGDAFVEGALMMAN